MSLIRAIGGRSALAFGLLAFVAALMILGAAEPAWAQGSPFGGPRGAPAALPPPDTMMGWLFAKQAAFYQDFSRIIRAAKTDGSAFWSLLGVAFLYGIFHAAGPGHGKAVISSYMVANEETWRRGIALSFAAALLQAVVAVAIVGIAAALLSATARQMCDAERVIELVSYALIALVGLRLVWVKGKGFLREARGLNRPLHAVGAAVTPPAGGHDHEHHQGHDHGHHDHHHDHGHAREHHHHDHGHGHHGHHHHHDHDHDHDSAWGHAHGPEPEELAGPGGWQRGLSAIVAVGLRPCSGAIILLVFALAQGLFWTGVAATFVMGIGTAITVALIATLAVGFRAAAKRLAASRSGYGVLMLRGVEVGAAVLVLCFGTLLLLGFMAAERGACF